MNQHRDNHRSISVLRQAFQEQRLCLFLGAGVSVANGLPAWEKLVLRLYFAAISEQEMAGWRPYSNYLYAISEWYLEHSNEPLEITARKVRSLYDNRNDSEQAFVNGIRDALYGAGTKMNPLALLEANKTLRAIVRLCRAQHNDRHGVRAVISYNYDNLLEQTLGEQRPHQPVYSPQCDSGSKLPIFHVHGYVPHEGDEMDGASGIIFTEEQYNTIASDPYSWPNIIQLREMSSSVGLMVGLSLSDRNIRRLLDALSNAPVSPQIFALLQKPQQVAVSDADADRIHRQAKQYLDRFRSSGVKSRQPIGDETGYFSEPMANSGIKAGGEKSSRPAGGTPFSGRKGETRYQYEIRGIIKQVERIEQDQQEAILRQLGIQPIWYQEHSDIPRFVQEIHNQ